MNLPTRIEIAFLIFLLATFIFQMSVDEVFSGGLLKLALRSNKMAYELGEEVLVSGTLTLNGSAASDGLVAIQVNDPQNNLFALRTRPTGEDATGPWSMEIVEIFPCDMEGTPKYSFRRGSSMGINVTVRNNDANPNTGLVFLSFYYGDNVPFAAFLMWNVTLSGGKTKSLMTYPCTNLPQDAAVGEAMIYVNLLRGLPEKNGFAYTPEKTIVFNITSGTYTQTSENLPVDLTAPGGFNISLRVSDHGGLIGNYSVHTSCFYYPLFTTNRTTFEAELIGDLNGDNWVDISDIAIVARAYGSDPTKPNWNPIADLSEPWGLIDISDISFIGRRYGKYGTQ